MQDEAHTNYRQQETYRGCFDFGSCEMDQLHVVEVETDAGLKGRHYGDAGHHLHQATEACQ